MSKRTDQCVCCVLESHQDPARTFEKMKADPLTDILTLANARCVITRSFAAGGSWAIRFPALDRIKFVAIVKGGCWLDVEGVVTRFRLEMGDVFMLSPRRPYALAADLNATVKDGSGIFTDVENNYARVGEGDEFLAVAGHIDLDSEHGRVLTDVLPSLLHVSRNAPQAAAMQWLLDQLVQEVTGVSEQPGAGLASAQLAQLLFLQILRSHVATSGPLLVGWIGALGDERISRALHLMHRQPARAWQLGELAKEAGMSRTSFALRFKATAGVAPLAYLLNWRMRLAEHELRKGSMSIAELAKSLGYTSESAFSNAFKRIKGMAPKRYKAMVVDTVVSAPSAAQV
jgi:AraC-like DNA-binding protein